jgi:uroporphyrinogen III methyltransferase / synthase
MPHLSAYSKHRPMAKQRHLSSKQGKVFFVGAGPGAPGLITWRGVECLRQADVVLYDYLVNPAVLRHANPSAQLICLGRHGAEQRERIWSQQEVNERLVQFAVDGKRVVRLKGGDPIVFGRLAEEVSAMEAANIQYEVVPGVTSGLAAASFGGVWITQRETASAVALVTGHESDSDHAPNLDYAALAAFPGTLIFYMGVTTAREWTGALLKAGKPGNTPAAIVRRCSWPDQRSIRCTLGTIVDELEAATLRPPVVIIIGDVVECSPAETWFSRRPLFGKRILLTRPIDRAGSLYDPLTELGAECLVQPAIEISPPDDWGSADSALSKLQDYDSVVFSSVNGVQYFLDRLFELGGDLRKLGGVSLAAIGPGTADELARYHLRVDSQPPEVYRAEALAELLTADARGKRFLLARASRGREVLAEQLLAAGAHVEQVVVYTSSDVAAPEPSILKGLAEGRIDWVTVTSSAIARSLVHLFGPLLSKSKLVSISPVTSATLRGSGYEPNAEAAVYTMPGVIDAILAAESADVRVEE